MIKFLDLKAVNERFRGELDAAAKARIFAAAYLLSPTFVRRKLLERM